MDFIKDHIEDIFGGLVIAAFIFESARALKKARRIESEGTEAEGTVVRIEENLGSEGSITYEVIVRYRDDQGAVRESPMAYTGVPDHAVGDVVRILYIPGEIDLVREVRD